MSTYDQQPDIRMPITPAGSYAVWTALLNQTGSSAPTAKVQNNSLGNIAWSRISTGNYVGTLTGGFAGDITFFPGQIPFINNPAFIVVKLTDNTINIQTASNDTPIDDALTDTALEIRRYQNTRPTFNFIAPEPDSIKCYIGFMSQTGTNDPIVTTLYNTIGNIVWTRFAQGVYYGTLTNAFPNHKTVTPNGGNSFQFQTTPMSYNTMFDYGYSVYRSDNDKIRVDVLKASDFSNVDISDIDSSDNILIYITTF